LHHRAVVYTALQDSDPAVRKAAQILIRTFKQSDSKRQKTKTRATRKKRVAKAGC
jgi:hypothetical protein